MLAVRVVVRALGGVVVEEEEEEWNDDDDGNGEDGTREKEDGEGEEEEKGKDNRDVDGDGNKAGDWIGDVVRTLDMAVIMAGGAGREECIEALMDALEEHELANPSSHSASSAPSLSSSPLPVTKRQKLHHHHHHHHPPTAKDENEDLFTTPSSSSPQQPHPPPALTYSIPIHTTPPSLAAFQQHLCTPPASGPLIIRNALTHWPAISASERSWRSRRYLLRRTLGGRRLVPVEVGRSYTDVEWGQRIVTFGEFLGGGFAVGKGKGKGKGKVEEEEGGGGGAEERKIGYLAQHDLFAQIPALRADIAVPDYCYATPPPPLAPASAEDDLTAAHKPSRARLEEPLLNAWFGPAGTISPLHTDPYHNILCQVVGQKYVRLYAPEETWRVYPRGVEEGGVDMSNTSQVDVEGDSREMHERFPLFREARYVEGVLGEGECLYIPVGWWHYVRSLTVSFSVSFWWD